MSVPTVRAKNILVTNFTASEHVSGVIRATTGPSILTRRVTTWRTGVRESGGARCLYNTSS